jgi:hypothetical protein
VIFLCTLARRLRPLTIVFALAACGASAKVTPDAATAGNAGSGGAGSGAAGASACGPRGTYGGGETSTTANVVAAVVDETGAPAGDVVTYVCGINLCSDPKKTDVGGKVSITSTLSFKGPAFRYGDGVTYAELAVPLTMTSTDLTAGGAVLGTGKLSDKPGEALTAGASATSGDVQIAVPAGAAIGIDTLVYGTADQQKLRTVSIPLTNLGPVLAAAALGSVPAGFALVYGVSPAETTFCPAVQVSVTLPHKTTTQANDLGWAPGTAVEFWVTTIDVGQTYAPYAGWAKMSDGTVSSDGATVTTSSGAVENDGFVYLDTFAIRKAP